MDLNFIDRRFRRSNRFDGRIIGARSSLTGRFEGVWVRCIVIIVAIVARFAEEFVQAGSAAVSAGMCFWYNGRYWHSARSYQIAEGRVIQLDKTNIN